MQKKWFGKSANKPFCSFQTKKHPAGCFFYAPHSPMPGRLKVADRPQTPRRAHLQPEYASLQGIIKALQRTVETGGVRSLLSIPSGKTCQKSRPLWPPSLHHWRSILSCWNCCLRNSRNLCDAPSGLMPRWSSWHLLMAPQAYRGQDPGMLPLPLSMNCRTIRTRSGI